MKFKLSEFEVFGIIIGFLLLVLGGVIAGLLGLGLIYLILDDLDYHPDFDPLNFTVMEKDKKDDSSNNP